MHLAIRLYPSALAKLTGIVFLALSLFSAAAFAQPVKGQHPVNLDQLQMQLKMLQDQIDELNTPEDPFDSSRVKSIGSQRQNRAPTRGPDEALYIRLYDLSDIFAVSPHYPAIETDEIGRSGQVFTGDGSPVVQSGGGGGFGGGGLGGGGLGGGGSGGVFNMPVNSPKTQEPAMMNLQSTQVSMSQLVSAIKATVSPNEWGDSDDQAKIQFLGNTLLITANSDMHKQINNLLNLFREHWGKRRTVSIQAYWIRSNPLAIKGLLGNSNSEIGAAVIDAEPWSKFLEVAQTEHRIPYASLLTGHNNQTLNTNSGRRKLLVSGATPFHSTSVTQSAHLTAEELDDEDTNVFLMRSRGVSGFTPIRHQFHRGNIFQVTPLATRGGNFVILDLHSRINELVDLDQAAQSSIFTFRPNGEKAEVKLDNAEYVTYHLSTTLRCPKDQVVLAGGMSYDSAVDSDQPELYLFVKVNVHTITEDKSDWVATDTKPDSK